MAVALSLSCTPALAASFDDVQNAVDGDTSAGVWIEDSEKANHYGYGDKNEDTGYYGVESWGDAASVDGRTVQLYEDVTKEDGTRSGIEVGAEDGNVSLDLNGTTWYPTTMTQRRGQAITERPHREKAMARLSKSARTPI